MSNNDVILAALVVMLGGAGTYLILPHRHGRTRPRTAHGFGLVSAGLALLVFLTFWSPPGPFLPTLFFYVFGVTAIAGGFLTVTSRNPIYSALWFASVVLVDGRPLPPGGSPVPGGRYDHRLRGRHHRDVPVRDHAGPDGWQGGLRPRGPGSRGRHLDQLPAVLEPHGRDLNRSPRSAHEDQHARSPTDRAGETAPPLPRHRPLPRIGDLTESSPCSTGP